MRAFELLPQDDPDTPKIANAKAQSLRNQEQASSTTFQEIIQTGADDAALAAIALIDRHIEDDTAIPQNLLALIDTYAFELRETDAAPSVFRAQVLASAQSSQFGKATTEFAFNRQSFGEAELRDLSSILFSKIAENASDSEFIESYFLDYPSVQELLHSDTKLLVGERLYELGFLDDLGGILADVKEQTTSEEARILHAKYFYSKEEYEGSLAILSDISTPESAMLRAELLQALGENEAASQFFAEANLPEMAASASWLSENWVDLVNSSDPLFGPVQELARHEPPEILPDNDMLESTSIALQESSQSRETLVRLLDSLNISE